MRVLLAITLLAACGPEDREARPDAPVSQPDASPDGDLLPDVPIDETSRVFAHTGNTLYQVDDVDFTSDEVGTISGLPVGGGGQTVQLLDLALDGNDRMLGVTAEEIYELDSATGAATLVAALPEEAQGATSLSFIPRDGGAADILVTANGAGNVYQINLVSGAATLLGNYGMVGGKQIRSSGDLFGVRDFGIFATVDVEDDPTGLDYLARIDPVTWRATLVGEGTGFDKIFGLGFWAGKIYGFVDDGFEMGGKLIEIDPVTGDAISRKQGTLRWFGAAVATDAPIIGRTAK